MAFCIMLLLLSLQINMSSCKCIFGDQKQNDSGLKAADGSQSGSDSVSPRVDTDSNVKVLSNKRETS